MSDYKVSLGAEVRTKEIDKQLQNYNGNVNVTVNPNTIKNGIDAALNGYEQTITVNSTLDTKGILDKIDSLNKKSNRKTISFKVDPDWSGIDGDNGVIASKYFKTQLRVGVDLDWRGVAQQITTPNWGAGGTPKLNLEVGLDDTAIVDAVQKYLDPKTYKTKTISFKVNPDLSDTASAWEQVEEKLQNYSAKNPIRANVVLRASAVNKAINDYNKELAADNGKRIIFNAVIRPNAIDDAITNYKNEYPDKLKLPIDLDINSSLEENTEFESKLKQKLAQYEENPVWIPVKLKPASKGFKDNIKNVTVDVTANLVNSDVITDAFINYAKEPLPIGVKLMPGKNFTSELTKTPITIDAELAPDAINNAITNPSKPFSKIPIGVELKTKDANDINKQVQQLKPFVTEPLNIDVKLDEKSVDNAITTIHPATPLGVNVKLLDDDINKQVEAIVPTSKIKVNVKIEDDNINTENGNQAERSPINVNVKLNEKSINDEIKAFKTDSKIKVGVKLDFASHKNENGEEIQKGISRQLKEYKGKTKLRVGVALDGSSIEESIRGLTPTTPITVGIQIDPNAIQNVQNEITNLRQQLQNIGNINVNIGGNGNGNGGGGNGGGNGGRGGRRQIDDVTRAYRELISLQNRIGRHQQSIADLGLDTSENQREVLALSNTIDDLFDRYQRIRQLFNGRFNDVQIDALNRGFQTVNENLNITVARADDARNALAQSINTSLEDGSFDKQMSRVENGISGLLNVSSDVQRELNNVRTAFREMEEAYATDNIEALIAANERYEASLKSLKNQLDINKVSDARDKQAIGILGDLIDSDFDNQVDKVNRDFDKLSSKSEDTKTAVSQLNQALVDMTSAANRGDIDGLIKAHERYVECLKSARNQIAIQQRSDKDIASEYKDDIAELQAISDKISKIKIRIAGLDDKSNANEISFLTNELEKLEKVYQDLRLSLQGQLSSNQFSKLWKDAEEANAEIERIGEQLKDTKAKLASKINIKLTDGTLDKDLTNITSKFNSLRNKSEDTKAAMNEFNAALERVRAASAQGDEGIDELIKANQDYERALKAVKNQLDINARLERDSANEQKLVDDRLSFQSKIDAWLRTNSAAVDKFGAQMIQLKGQAESCDRVTLDHLQNEFKQLDMEAEAAGLKMQSFTDRIKTQVMKYSAYFGVAEMIMYATQAVKDMFEQVKLIDSAMTELKKVTDETDESYNRFLNNAASRAKVLGTTIDGLVNSTAEFAKLGYDFNESQGLAEVANIYAVVGDEIEGVEGATQSLVSTLAAFRHEMGDMSDSDFAMGIVDKFNEVANRYSISSGGIGEALQRAASSMAAANNTLDETIALTTAANEVAQNPEKVGNALKTMSMRIRAAKTELEEAGESTDGMAESTASLRQEMLALSGVDIMLNENTFKSTYQIMDELSDKWANLSDIAQATIIELVAGKHQGNVFSSLMANFDVARKALETSATSSGSAMKEHAKWSESLEARLNKLKAAWQSLSQSFLSSDFLKSLIDAAIKFVDVLDTLINKIGVLPTVIGGFTLLESVFGKNKIASIFQTMNTDLDGFTNKIGIANKSLSELVREFNSGNTRGGFKWLFDGLLNVRSALKNPLSNSDLSAMRSYNDLIDQCVGSQTAWYRTMQKASPAAQNLVAAANGGKVAMQGLTAATKASRVATVGMTVAATAMNMAITMGISALITWGIKKLDEWIVTADELAEKAEEVTSKYKEQHEELLKLKGNYNTSDEDSMISKYAKLSKGVDDLGRNISLTTDEYSEYKDIVNSIAGQIPSLVTGYDSQGNAILSCKGNVEELTREYERLIKAQNDSVLSGENASNIIKDFKNAMKDAKTSNATSTETTTHTINALETMLNGSLSQDKISTLLDNLRDSKKIYGIRGQIVNELEERGIENDLHWYSLDSAYDEFIANAIKEHPNVVKEIINDFNSTLEAETDGVKAQAAAVLSNAFDISSSEYSGMSEEIQNLAYQIVDSFDAEKFNKIIGDGTNKNAIEDYINGVLDVFSKLEKTGDIKEIEAAFNLKTQFNSGEISYGDYVTGLQNVENFIDGIKGLDNDVKNQIKLSLNTEQVENEYNALKKRLETTGFAKDAEEFLKNLTASEYAVAVDLIANSKLDLSQFNFDINSLREYIKKQADIEEALNFTINIEAETAGIESLNTALAESKSAIGLTSESISAIESRYKDLDGYNAATLFEETANGIRLNSTELAKLEKEYKDFNKQKTDETLKTLKEEYDRLTDEINNCTDDQEKLNSLYYERDAILNQINDTATLAAQYEGLTSAYNEWQSAQEAGQDRDMYESVLSGREDIEGEMSRGWLDDASVEYLELLSGKELSTAGIDAQIAAYKELNNAIGNSGYSIWDFFTKDEDGNSTSEGVFNFFDTVKSVAGETAAWVDENGKYNFDFEGFEYNGKTGDAAIADILGTSEELVQILLRAAEDAGFVINIKGDYTDLANLKTEAEAANDRMKELGATTYTFDFNSSSIDNLNEQIGEAETMLSNLKNDDGTLKVGVSEEDYRQAQYILEALISQRQLLERPAIMDIEIPFKEAESDIGKATKAVQDLQNNLWELEKSGCNPNINSENIRVEIGNIITELNTLEKSDPQIYAKLGLDDIEIANLKTAISNIQASINTNIEPSQEDLATVQSAIQGIDATVVANYLSGEQTPPVDENALVNYELGTQALPEDKPAKVNYELGTQVSPVSKTAKVNYVHEVNGTANANGTTSGTAFKHGSWGIKGNGTALVGELGTETLVRDGHYYTIGDNGAEFIKYRQGDIIFNHKQTEELFKNGKVTSGGGRGKALAEGTAFAIGSNASGVGRGVISTATRIARDNEEVKIKTETTVDGNSGSSGSGSTKNDISSAATPSSSSYSSSSGEDKFEESFDWIEVAISRIERAIDQLDKTANNVYKSWSERNSALTGEISKVGDEIYLQQQAYDRYMQEANNVGLSESYTKMVREGTISIEDFEGEGDEALVEKIKDYQTWYEKALACKDAIDDLKETESSLYAQRFENVQSQYDAILQGYEHTETMLNEYISQAEAKGHIVSKQYYNALIENEKSNINELKREQADLIAQRDQAVSDGAITRYSEEWYNMCAEIDSVTQAIEEGNTALIEYGNSIRDINWEVFDLIQERISDVTEEADFLIELMSNKDLYNDSGELTNQGLATMALHGQNYNAYMYQADDYGAEVAELNKQIAQDKYNQELIDRRNELLDLQRESILAAEEEKNAIADLVEEGINIQLDALQELIDKKNEELESERDLYEYQKKVKEQTEEIASLEKQMAAYSGDDSDEARQKIQQIKVDLETAREDLKETEWDKYIDDTSAILDTLYNEYELILNTRLDNIDYLLQQVVDGINAAYGAEGTVSSALSADGAIAQAIVAAMGVGGSVSTILNTEANNVGTTLSNAMNNIWNGGNGDAKSVLTMYGNGFQNQQTTTNTTLSNIKADIAAMVDDVDKNAQKKLETPKTQTSAVANPTSTQQTNPPKAQENKTTYYGDGTPKVGDKVKFVSGQYYYDSQGAKPIGSKYQGKEVYITSINTKSWATHPYHISTGSKLGSGDLGWLKLDQLSGYAVGKKNFLDNELAWTQENAKKNGKEFIVRPSDGAILTPIAKGDSVLTSTASNNIWDMANSPAEFIKNNLNLGTASVPNNSVVQSNYTQYLDKVVFNLPNVKNYDELLAAMQKDKNFERLILSMSIDRIAGKSSLAKGKSIR